jgi:hypothetical protein
MEKELDIIIRNTQLIMSGKMTLIESQKMLEKGLADGSIIPIPSHLKHGESND